MIMFLLGAFAITVGVLPPHDFPVVDALCFIAGFAAIVLGIVEGRR